MRVNVPVSPTRLVRATHMAFLGERYREIGTRKELELGEFLYEQRCALEEYILGYALFDGDRLMGVVQFDNGPRPVSRGDTISVDIRTFGVSMTKAMGAEWDKAFIRGLEDTVAANDPRDSRVLEIRWSPDRQSYMIKVGPSKVAGAGNRYFGVINEITCHKNDNELDKLGYSPLYGHRIEGIPAPEQQFKPGDVVYVKHSEATFWTRGDNNLWYSTVSMLRARTDDEVRDELKTGRYVLRGNLRDFK